MRFKNIAALAAASLVVASSAAAAQEARTPPSAAPARAGADLAEANDLQGEGIRVYLIAIVALAAAAYLILEVIGGKNNDDPVSP